ncbi:glycosyltransferase, partial [Candidatus Dependentiae bacterium]|nr:glycosyltransferase [Candidatus Dependentiae bacterium]
NEEKYIEPGLKCIEISKQILLSKYPEVKIEVILSDNNSLDKTSSIAEKYVDKIIKNDKNSIAGVRNSGVSVSSGEILVFIDADSQMHKNSLLKIYELFVKTDIKAGCVKILTDEKLNFILNSIVVIVNFCFKIMNSGGGMYYCLKKDFDAINGFNENLYAAEDLDFANRIKKLMKQKKCRFVNLSDIPIITSARKVRFVNKFNALIKFIKFIVIPKKVLYNKSEWEDLFYKTDKLR